MEKATKTESAKVYTYKTQEDAKAARAVLVAHGINSFSVPNLTGSGHLVVAILPQKELNEEKTQEMRERCAEGLDRWCPRCREDRARNRAALHAAADTLRAVVAALRSKRPITELETIARNLAGPASIIPQVESALGLRVNLPQEVR